MKIKDIFSSSKTIKSSSRQGGSTIYLMGNVTKDVQSTFAENEAEQESASLDYFEAIFNTSTEAEVVTELEEPEPQFNFDPAIIDLGIVVLQVTGSDGLVDIGEPTDGPEAILNFDDLGSILGGADERTFASSKEEFSGEELKTAEKPKIMAVVSREITNGFPKSNIIFVKGISSPRVLVEKYSIYRKRIFLDRVFTKVKELTLEDVHSPMNLEHEKILKKTGMSTSSIFSYEDFDIDPTHVYAYKISVKWRVATEAEQQQAEEEVEPSEEGSEFLSGFIRTLPLGLVNIEI